MIVDLLELPPGGIPPEEDPAAVARDVIAVLTADQAAAEFREYFEQSDDGLSLASTAADLAVRLAIEQYRQGVHEEPLGSNSGPPLERYVRWFVPSSGPVSWCAYFVSWCFDRATDSNRQVPWGSPGWVPSIYQWARGNGRLVGVPQHGDVFGIGGEHCGLIRWAGGGEVGTVEGNYEDRVICVRRRDTGLWFARI